MSHKLDNTIFHTTFENNTECSAIYLKIINLFIYLSIYLSICAYVYILIHAI